MKQTTIIFVLTIFFDRIAFPQSAESILSDIRLRYTETQKNISSYDTALIDISGESTEGGQAIGYYDKGNLRLIEVLLWGEHGKEKSEYYFDASKLFFVFKIDFKYNRPFYFDSSMAKEYNDTAYDPAKTISEENRYYFYNRKLIRWINSDKEEVDSMTQNFSEVEQELLTYSDRLRNRFPKSN